MRTAWLLGAPLLLHQSSQEQQISSEDRRHTPPKRQSRKARECETTPELEAVTWELLGLLGEWCTVAHSAPHVGSISCGVCDIAESQLCLLTATYH
jgi:hypothetical protein